MSFEADHLRNQRLAGILVPVFSLRGRQDLGIGDVAALREFIDFCADAGFSFVQLLPINETGPDNSPYNAISSVALEPTTLDCTPQGLVDLTEEDFAEVLSEFDIDALRAGAVDYASVRRLKEDLLSRAYARFFDEHFEKGSSRDREFQQFCEDESGWLNDYCLFRMAMKEHAGNPNWQEWGESLQTLEGATAHVTERYRQAPEETDRAITFFAYVQWIAFRQWRSVANYGQSKRVWLMGDIPFGISASSADVFADREIFDVDWYGGAPPEKLFKDDEFVQKWGQNWGIPLYRWDVMDDRGYRWWRQRVQKCVEVCRLFRVDHALGFYRIYSFPWNPVRNEEFLPLTEDEAAERCGGRRPGFRPRADDSPENEQANRADGERYLRVIQEAAGTAEVIAEDLGVVPDYVRPSLAELGIAGTKVPQWEFSEGHVTPGVHYPALSFATYATHDHAPMKAQWEAARQAFAEAEPESHEWWENRNFLHVLCAFAGIPVHEDAFPVYDDAVHEALLRQLCLSNSRRVGIMVSDLLGFEERINVPGIMDGSNWSYRLPMSSGDLATSPEWEKIRNLSRRILEDSGRTPVQASS